MNLPSNWRSPAVADDYAQHDFADFAQEFLRRNPYYQADYETGFVPEPAPRDDDTKDGRRAVAAKWGLAFCGRSAGQSARRAGLVAPRDGPRRSHIDPGARALLPAFAIAWTSAPDRAPSLRR
jgi:hypothetical protein